MTTIFPKLEIYKTEQRIALGHDLHRVFLSLLKWEREQGPHAGYSPIGA